MNKPLYVLLTSLLFSFTVAPAFGQSFDSKISVRQWTNDIERFNSEVMQPLRERFDAEGCHEGRIGYYFDLYQEQLDTVRDQVTPMSFLLLREIMLTNGRELGPIHEDLPCSTRDRWQLLDAFIHSKVNFIGNILSLLEVAGSL